MTINELIEKLKEHPGNMRVVVKSPGKGFNDVDTLSTVHVHLNTSFDWHDGAHEESADGGTVALALTGENSNATLYNDMAP